MKQTHVLKVDGYHVAERLLEDVMFEVTITETDDDLQIVKVEPPADAAGYLRGINVSYYLPKIRDHVQVNIDYVKELAKGRKITVTALLDETQQEFPNEPRIEILNEV